MQDLVRELDKLVDFEGFAQMANMTVSALQRRKAMDGDEFPTDYGPGKRCLYKTGEIRAYLAKRREIKKENPGAFKKKAAQGRPTTSQD